MEITEVRIKLMEDSDDRLQAFCSITFDNCFVIRDLKIIEGTNGPFVAMPSRKLTSHCEKCGCKNHLRAVYCNHCGVRFHGDHAPRDEDGRAKLYADIAHPINSQCREMIQNRVIAEFENELELAKQPGYVSRYDEDFDVEFEAGHHGATPTQHRVHERTHEGRSTEARSSRSVSDRAHIEPAESQPRTPHIANSSNRDHAQRRRNDEFGAGIF